MNFARSPQAGAAFAAFVGMTKNANTANMDNFENLRMLIMSHSVASSKAALNGGEINSIR